MNTPTGEVTARVRQYASVDSQLTSVTPPSTWIIANFKETQMFGIAVGQQVTFTVDALTTPGSPDTARKSRPLPALNSAS